MSDLIFHAGAECYSLYGTLSKRTSEEEDVAETFTRAAEANAGYYVDRAGVLKQAETNVLRTEWTGSSFDTPNLLLEDARTNGFTFSEQMDNAAWLKDQATVTANPATAPDGATTADKLVEDSTASALHRIRRDTPALTDNTDTAFSVYAKAEERLEFELRVVDKAGTSVGSWFNVSTGLKGTAFGSPAAVRMTKFPDGWYRCEVVVDAASGATAPSFRLAMGSGGETSVYNGDGTSGLYFWGVQIEVDKPFASSYIKTVASTVTRNAETLSFPFVAPPQEMTVYVKFVEGGTTLTGTTTRLFKIGSTVSAAAPFLHIRNVSGKYGGTWDGGVLSSPSTMATAPSIADAVELRLTLSGAGVYQLHQSINSAAETSASSQVGDPLPTTWAGQLLFFNGSGDTSKLGFNKFRSIKVARGTKTMAEMRALGV